MEKDWDKINEKKVKEILLGQAINIVARSYFVAERYGIKDLLDRRESYKTDVKELVIILKELHKEVIK